MTAQESEETVTSHHSVPTIDIAQHKPQFIASDARIFLTDFAYILQQKILALDFRSNVSLGLLPSLTGMAKQTAREGDLKATPLHQFRHCLAPDFFRMGMLK